MAEKIENGDLVKDKISGIAGVVIGITDYLYGCRRLAVQEQNGVKDGRPTNSFYVDEPQAEIVQKAVLLPEPKAEKRYGPRDEPVDSKL